MSIDLIIMTVKNIFRKGFRTMLTLSGIAVGVASVVMISAMSNAGTAAVSAELDSLGLNGITVSSRDHFVSLDFDDAEYIRSVKGVKTATPVFTFETSVSLDENSARVMLWGAESGKDKVFTVNIDYGRDFSRSEISDCDSVCMIDKKIARSLFGRENAVGREIGVNIAGGTVACKIIGITSSDSSIIESVTGEMVPDFIYMPYTTLSELYNTDTVSSIAVNLIDGVNSKEIAATISSELSLSKGIENSVKTENLSLQRDKLNGVMSAVSGVLSIIGIISLVVAGLGILTVMLVSVNERTREIGVKKAVGASFFAVLSEFLVEALTISFMGSIIGAVFGTALSYIAGLIFKTTLLPSINSVFFAIFCAVISGSVFGLYPAIKAAKMRPVDALRYE